MKRLLIVSPHFPPVNAPDAQRVVSALPHLRALGWDAVVLCVAPGRVDAPCDEAAAAQLPSDIRVVRCGAWPLALTRPFGLRTLSRRAYGSLDRAGRKLIAEFQPDLVFFTTTQNGLVALGPIWKAAFGVPFAVDIQDPWVTPYYDRPGAPKPPGGWKYALAKRRNARLEARVFPEAAGIVSVAANYLRDLAGRHPALANTPQITLPFGIDEAAFARARVEARPTFVREPGKIHLVGVGAVGPIMAGATHALCRQLQRLSEAEPGLAARIRFHFIGTSYAPPESALPSVIPIAQDHGVEEFFSEKTDRIPWREAQANMAAADGLVVLTSDDPGYTPSKLAGCFLAGKPALIVTRPDTAAAKIGEALGLGLRLGTSDDTPNALSDYLNDLVAKTPTWPARRRLDLFQAEHTAAARTRALTDFFNTFIAGKPRIASP
jgi:hypothetical protein